MTCLNQHKNTISAKYCLIIVIKKIPTKYWDYYLSILLTTSFHLTRQFSFSHYLFYNIQIKKSCVHLYSNTHNSEMSCVYVWLSGVCFTCVRYSWILRSRSVGMWMRQGRLCLSPASRTCCWWYLAWVRGWFCSSRRFSSCGPNQSSQCWGWMNERLDKHSTSHWDRE